MIEEIFFCDKVKLPNISGVKEHGSRVDLRFDNEGLKKLGLDESETVGENLLLSIFENEEIILFSSEYDYGSECWRETKICKISNKRKPDIIKKLNEMLEEGEHQSTSYSELLKVLKSGYTGDDDWR